jgi:hypothetical protein
VEGTLVCSAQGHHTRIDQRQRAKWLLNCYDNGVLGMGLGMSTWSIFTEPYLDVPQNGLPQLHWPGDTEHVLLGGHDNDLRGCGAHVLSTQDHPCGTTPWQANSRSSVQRRMLGSKLLCVAGRATPQGLAGRCSDELVMASSGCCCASFTFFVCRIRTDTSRDQR